VLDWRAVDGTGKLGGELGRLVEEAAGENDRDCPGRWAALAGGEVTLDIISG
jgi:hypothetical protein